MYNKWKQFSHSLLLILTVVALGVMVIISMLISEIAEQSVSRFENFIIHRRQQETKASADALSHDLDTLNTLLFNALSDTSLIRVQLYLDSQVLSYNYLQQVEVVQKQFFSIEQALPLVRSIKVYMPDGQRVLSSESLFHYDQEEAPWLDRMFASKAQSMLVDGDQLLLYSARQAGDLLFRRSVAVVGSISQDTMLQYLQKYMAMDSSIAVYVQSDRPQMFAGTEDISDRFDEIIGGTIAASRSGAEQIHLDSIPYLLTWHPTTFEEIKLCQITPMSFLTDQLREYRRQISIVASAVILLMVGLVSFLYLMMRSPIRRMKTALERMEKGDLNVYIAPTWSREFQQIFSQFNQMTKKLNHLIDQEYKLKLLNVNAELKQMRYQINPHFLYNAYFNMRAMLLNEEYDTAVQMADLMGRYLRYITTSAQDEATLGEEMEHSISYLEIQKLRFGDQLQIQVGDYPAWANDLPVPRIIIQPLIENSFVHGLHNRSRTGIIAVEVIAKEDSLAIVVEDNGEAVTDETIAGVQRRLGSNEHDPNSPSVALLNIDRRIRMMYLKGSGLFVQRSRFGGFRAEILMIREKKHVPDDDR